ncbi:redoxin domain-containing protein [uncultured Dokdonia sp.]|nr:redoxin domain-containing protein [uncultured Dokdonia sp.]
MKGVDEVIEEAKAFLTGKDALQVGDKAPEFELPNPKKQKISLTTLLSQGPVVVTFYRGDWCPYCNLQLRALQSKKIGGNSRARCNTCCHKPTSSRWIYDRK